MIFKVHVALSTESCIVGGAVQADEQFMLRNNLVEVPELLLTQKKAHQIGVLMSGSYCLLKVEQDLFTFCRVWITSNMLPIAKSACYMRLNHELKLNLNVKPVKTSFNVSHIHPIPNCYLSSLRYVELHLLQNIDKRLLPSMSTLALALRRKILYDGMKISLQLNNTNTVKAVCRIAFACNFKSRLFSNLPRSGFWCVGKKTQDNEMDSDKFTDQNVLLSNCFGVVDNSCTVQVQRSTIYDHTAPISMFADIFDILKSKQKSSIRCTKSSNALLPNNVFDQQTLKWLVRLLMWGTMRRSLLEPHLPQCRPSSRMICFSKLKQSSYVAQTILLHGVRGSGKRSLIQRTLAEISLKMTKTNVSIPIFSLTCTELIGILDAEESFSWKKNQHSNAFRRFIDRVVQVGPAIVVLEDVENVFPRSSNSMTRLHVQKRYHTFIAGINIQSTIETGSKIAILSICRNIRIIEEEFLRAMDFEVNVPPATLKQQLNVFNFYADTFQYFKLPSMKRGACKVSILSQQQNKLLVTPRSMIGAKMFLLDYCTAFAPHDLLLIFQAATKWLNSLHSNNR